MEKTVSLNFFVPRFFRQIDNLFFLPQRVLYRLIRAAGVVLNVTYYKIRAIDHMPVSNLHRGFEMRVMRLRADLDLVIILSKAVFIVLKLRRVIRQDQNMRAVIVTKFSLYSPDCARNKLIEISVPADEKINVLVFTE